MLSIFSVLFLLEIRDRKISNSTENIKFYHGNNRNPVRSKTLSIPFISLSKFYNNSLINRFLYFFMLQVSEEKFTFGQSRGKR